MLSKKLALLLVVGVVQVETKDAGTIIVQFRVTSQDLLSKSKSFINKTNHKIKLRWIITDTNTHEFYAQEPIVDKNGSIEMGLRAALAYFELKNGVKPDDLNYEITVEIFKVLKTPYQKGDEMNTCSFKNGQKDLLISSATFLEADDFELRVDRSGNLDCRALLQPEVLHRKQR